MAHIIGKNVGAGKDKAYERLERYRQKRAAGATPEPFGAAVGARPRLFVVQKHAATRLHYDFRLEWRGTLWSWAVPNGPSMDPSANRLAVHVEDHPVDYADFEGVIPEGNYGAGTVIVWDKGLWVPIDDPDQMMETGKLHFELRGYKLRGEFILIRPKLGKEWLLKKKSDGYATEGESQLGEASIFSGLTVERLREGRAHAAQLAGRVAQAGALPGAVDPAAVELMLARPAPAPFSADEWLFELKYDGYRLLAARDGDGAPFLRSRNGHDLTAIFPEVARAVAGLPYRDLVLDGELVVLDAQARPSFQMLQQRSQLRRRLEIERAAVEAPATVFAFDLLALEGLDLRTLALGRRKEFLVEVLPGAGPLRYADHIVGRGEAMFDQVVAMGLEGVLAKTIDQPYRGGRSNHWLKFMADRTGDFVVVGFSEPQGSRVGFGALHLGLYEGDVLHYAGRVGTGFSDEQLATMRGELEAMRRAEPAATGAPTGAEHVWVDPEWVAEVRFKEVTSDKLLRAPVFVRRRDDKAPEECRRQDSDVAGVDREPLVVDEPAAVEPAQRSVPFTNLDKVFWPDEGYTKGDLIQYYESVWPWLEPYLRDRPTVLTRYPDGIDGKYFYQKDLPDFVASWVRRVRMWSEHAQREIEYLVCDTIESLLYAVNLGAIPLHIWMSRVDTIQRPDWCLLDLDPKDAPFADVVTLARSIRRLCKSIELDSYVKTTGSSGLHILLPLGGQCTFEQSRQLGLLVARVIERQHPDIATTQRVLSARRGRVYLDYLQNRHGQLMVAPYIVRPLPGAPVSAPLTWREVNAKLTPRQFTIANLGRRLKRRTNDPNLAVMDGQPDLVAALERLVEFLD